MITEIINKLDSAFVRLDAFYEKLRRPVSTEPAVTPTSTLHKSSYHTKPHTIIALKNNNNATISMR